MGTSYEGGGGGGGDRTVKKVGQVDHTVLGTVGPYILKVLL